MDRQWISLVGPISFSAGLDSNRFGDEGLVSTGWTECADVHVVLDEGALCQPFQQDLVQCAVRAVLKKGDVSICVVKPRLLERAVGPVAGPLVKLGGCRPHSHIDRALSLELRVVDGIRDALDCIAKPKGAQVPDQFFLPLSLMRQPPVSTIESRYARWILLLFRWRC